MMTATVAGGRTLHRPTEGAYLFHTLARTLSSAGRRRVVGILQLCGGARASSTLGRQRVGSGWGGGGRSSRLRPSHLFSGGAGLIYALVIGDVAGGDGLHCAPSAESPLGGSDPAEWGADPRVTWYEWAWGSGSGGQAASDFDPVAPPVSAPPGSLPGPAGGGGTGSASGSGSSGADGGGPASAVLNAINLEEFGVQISLGTVAGFCSGYALKKVSKAAAIAVGLGFVGVQLARYNGLISDIDWGRVQGALVHALDADGDGQVTAADLKTHLGRLIDVLGFNLPSGAAFGAAFLLGLRYG